MYVSATVLVNCNFSMHCYEINTNLLLLGFFNAEYESFIVKD